jgi:hypothetical protein
MWVRTGIRYTREKGGAPMRMLAEEIRQDFEAAGWDVGRPVGEEEAERLEMAVRGEAGKYTITAHRSVLVLDEPVLELCDRDLSRVAWVRKVPTPDRAAELLAKYGSPADEADTMDPATSPLPPTVPEEDDR